MTVYAIIEDGNVRKDLIYKTKEIAMEKLYKIRNDLDKLYTDYGYDFEIENVNDLDGFWVTMNGEFVNNYFVQELEVRKH